MIGPGNPGLRVEQTEQRRGAPVERIFSPTRCSGIIRFAKKNFARPLRLRSEEYPGACTQVLSAWAPALVSS